VPTKIVYTNEPNKKLKEEGKKFKVWTAQSKDHDDYELRVHESNIVQEENSLFVKEGAEVIGI